MKTRLLILTAIIALSLVIPHAFGIPFFSEEQRIEGGQFIAIGKITSYHDEGIYRFYDAKIIKWLKNPLDQKTVSFRSINEKGFEPHAPKAIFEVGDYAVINLRDYSRGFLESTFFSYKISEDQIESEIKRIEDLVELKIPLPLDIRKSMWNSCLGLGDGFSKEEKYFWETLHIRLLSITPEFKSANGKLGSITIQSIISANSCPPLTGLNGTFASANGEEHRFRLEYNGDIFKYQIDDIFPPQYEGVMESPLKQFKSGIPWDVIQCKENLVLVLKSSNGSSVCVKPETKEKLIERGWTLALQNQPLSYPQKEYVDSIPLDFSNAANENPLGIEAKVVNEPDTAIMCPIENCKIPPTPHLVLTSQKGSQFVGYEVCDGLSCKKGRVSDGLYVWLSNIPKNYSGLNSIMISHVDLGDLPWKKDDIVHIKVIAFPATLLENNVVVRHTDQIMIVDLGKSRIE